MLVGCNVVGVCCVWLPCGCVVALASVALVGVVVGSWLCCVGVAGVLCGWC